ncbi:MAG: ribosome biogenesis GTP-binding protein YihA/YsxC, partial [Pseudobdellovibrio sp.]
MPPNKKNSFKKVDRLNHNKKAKGQKSSKARPEQRKSEKVGKKPQKNKVIFIKSGFLPKDYPEHNKKEVAFVGRSNAGKSSLINALAGEKIAHVSQTPGKTRLLNFFSYGESYVLVDMPGYGFAARSGSEVEEWQKVIETYLARRENLAGLVLVMDVRRDWDDNEKMLYDFSHRIGLPLLVALTKIDRLNKKELNERLKVLTSTVDTSLLFPVSSTNK